MAPKKRKTASEIKDGEDGEDGESRKRRTLRRRSWPRQVMAGDAFAMVGAMYDASALIGNWDALQKRLDRDGYLLLRGLLPVEDVCRARAHIVSVLSAENFLLPKSDPNEAWCRDSSLSPGLLARSDVSHASDVIQLLEHPKLYQLFDGLFQEPSATTEYKWLRAVARQKFTGVHTDRVYLGQGSQRLLTAWVPIGSVSTEEGAIMVASGSNRSRRFARLRQTYGQSVAGTDGTESGWLSRNGDEVAKAMRFRWLSADFEPGDLCVLSLDTLHLSASNQTNKYRISCDTRWQPLNDSIDPRLKLSHRVLKE